MCQTQSLCRKLKKKFQCSCHIQSRSFCSTSLRSRNLFKFRTAMLGTYRTCLWRHFLSFSTSISSSWRINSLMWFINSVSAEEPIIRSRSHFTLRALVREVFNAVWSTWDIQSKRKESKWNHRQQYYVWNELYTWTEDEEANDDASSLLTITHRKWEKSSWRLAALLLGGKHFYAQTE